MCKSPNKNFIYFYWKNKYFVKKNINIIINK